MIMIIIAVVVVLILLWVISTYNKFVKLQNKVEEAFSTMDVYLKKRYDLIPNLVETIKGYTKHEAETLEKVIRARNLAVNAQSLDEKIKTEKNFQSMLGPLYAISEQYPNLKADILPNCRQSCRILNLRHLRKYYNAVCGNSIIWWKCFRAICLRYVPQDKTAVRNRRCAA
ncbi:MAG: LemA family protein [[Clostridium] innocuum]